MSHSELRCGSCSVAVELEELPVARFYPTGETGDRSFSICAFDSSLVDVFEMVMHLAQGLTQFILDVFT